MCGAALIQRGRSGAMNQPSGSPNWEGPSRTEPLMPPATLQVLLGSPPRFTAVTLILMSGSVFGGAQTQPHWVSSYSMGTKLDALHSWLDAGHGRPFWLAVGCGHPFRTAVAGSGFCAESAGHPITSACGRATCHQEVACLISFPEGETEVPNVAWGHRAKKLRVCYWNSTFYFQGPFLFLFFF